MPYFIFSFMKQCIKCHELLDESNFYKREHGKLYNTCKKCKSSYQKNNYKASKPTDPKLKEYWDKELMKRYWEWKIRTGKMKVI